ncbi:MAG: hypothetical protein ACOYLT_00725 [Flavobacterium sp.]|uniref:hypothetical protein n=1 Tax=Flavobacterium sp. TaxID=239 RepID=UPI003BD27701
MKKRLESELISIAHRVLKLKNKSEVDQLYKETQKLYETIAVLKFYQDNFESIKDDVSEAVIEEKIKQSIESDSLDELILEVKEETVTEENSISEEIEEISEVIMEEEAIEEEIIVEENKENEPEIDEEEPVFKPIFELEVDFETHEEEDTSDNELTEEMESVETKKAVLEEFLGENYSDPIFVKPNEVSLFSDLSETQEEEAKPTSQNTNFSKSVEIGLNDRIAFVNNLFGESNEDFNRVLSQLNTFDSFEEAKNFIDEMVKPDYNNWQGEEDFAERFMEVVEKKFQ